MFADGNYLWGGKADSSLTFASAGLNPQLDNKRAENSWYHSTVRQCLHEKHAIQSNLIQVKISTNIFVNTRIDSNIEFDHGSRIQSRITKTLKIDDFFFYLNNLTYFRVRTDKLYDVRTGFLFNYYLVSLIHCTSRTAIPYYWYFYFWLRENSFFIIFSIPTYIWYLLHINLFYFISFHMTSFYFISFHFVSFHYIERCEK